MAILSLTRLSLLIYYKYDFNFTKNGHLIHKHVKTVKMNIKFIIVM
jgi:hypothetical protein